MAQIEYFGSVVRVRRRRDFAYCFAIAALTGRSSTAAAAWSTSHSDPSAAGFALRASSERGAPLGGCFGLAGPGTPRFALGRRRSYSCDSGPTQCSSTTILFY